MATTPGTRPAAACGTNKLAANGVPRLVSMTSSPTGMSWQI